MGTEVVPVQKWDSCPSGTQDTLSLVDMALVAQCRLGAPSMPHSLLSQRWGKSRSTQMWPYVHVCTCVHVCRNTHVQVHACKCRFVSAHASM